LTFSLFETWCVARVARASRVRGGVLRQRCAVGQQQKEKMRKKKNEFFAFFLAFFAVAFRRSAAQTDAARRSRLVWELAMTA
jgi:hypothetical protein